MIDATVKESGACVTATRDRVKTGKLSSPSGSPVPGRQHVESHAAPCKSLSQCPMVHRACLFPPRQHRTGDNLPSTWLDVSAGFSKREACSQRNRSREKVIIAVVALQRTRKLQKQHSCRRDIHRGRTRTSSWRQWLTPTRCPVWCEACAYPLIIGRVRPYSRDTTATRRVRRPREGACGQDTIAVSSWYSAAFPLRRWRVEAVVFLFVVDVHFCFERTARHKCLAQHFVSISVSFLSCRARPALNLQPTFRACAVRWAWASWYSGSSSECCRVHP